MPKIDLYKIGSLVRKDNLYLKVSIQTQPQILQELKHFFGLAQVSPGLVETEIIYATKPHQVELSKQIFATYPHLKADQVHRFNQMCLHCC